MDIPILFQELKTKLQIMFDHSTNWLSHVQTSYGKSKDADGQKVKSIVSSKQKVIESFRGFLLDPAKEPQTSGDLRAVAAKSESYLELTQQDYEVLDQLSQSDPEAKKHAHSVKEAREVVSEHIERIKQEETRVHTGVPTGPAAVSGSSSPPASSYSAAPPTSGPTPSSTASSAPGSGQPTAAQTLLPSPPPPPGQPGSPLAAAPAGGGGGGGGGPSDELFWLRDALPQNNKNKRIIRLTEKLLKGPLDDPKDQKRLAKLTVEELVAGWEKGVTKLVNQTKPVIASGDPQEASMAISALFFVHKQLQSQLYANLNATVIQQQPVTIQF
jgi:hypothetical protein